VAVHRKGLKKHTRRGGPRNTPFQDHLQTAVKRRFPEPVGKSEPAPVRDRSGSTCLPGLDGLRALAVIAVLIYHARPEWLPGGFLGVEVFFVISGFIITRALLIEWQSQGRIAVGSFWLRRARRLLPAVFLLLAGTIGYAALLKPEQMGSLRLDVLAALGYVTNWHLILAEQSYFDSFLRPSMLRHLWSLAVEEQFYVVWPLLLALGLPILKRRGLLVVVIGGIVASTAAMALLYEPGADTARVYFGTDTRAAGLLVGAALAFIVAGRSLQPKHVVKAWRQPAVALLGMAALSLIIAAMLWLDDGRPLLYRGGFLAVSLATSVVILAATQRNLFAGLLGLGPLRWVGVRSYGIYLWHWPVYMLLWPAQPTLWQVAGQVTAVVLISAVSYQLVEKPVREGALARAWAKTKSGSLPGLRYRRMLAFSAGATTVVLAGLVALMVLTPGRQTPAYFEMQSIRIRSNVVVSDVTSVVRKPTAMNRVQTAISAFVKDVNACGFELQTVPVTGGQGLGPDCAQTIPVFQRPAAAEGLLGKIQKPRQEAPAAEPKAENRANCDSIRGTQYLSMEERQWFLDNCLTQPAVPVGSGSPVPASPVPPPSPLSSPPAVTRASWYRSGSG
jgi:peptidoglycan/LPS O-acetylase OafA/YrhL